MRSYGALLRSRLGIQVLLYLFIQLPRRLYILIILINIIQVIKKCLLQMEIRLCYPLMNIHLIELNEKHEGGE